MVCSTGLNSTRQPDRTDFIPGQRLVLWVLWLTYGSFYFCRNNLGIALPGLGAELGYNKGQLGTVLMGLKLAYAVGQFINGQLAERFSPRKLLAFGAGVLVQQTRDQPRQVIGLNEIETPSSNQ